jgi:hypothetical protein
MTVEKRSAMSVRLPRSENSLARVWAAIGSWPQAP